MSLRNYGQNLRERVNEKSPFVVVVDERGNEKVVHKSSVCWMLSKDKHKLSSDRWVRVSEQEYSVKSTGKENLFLLILRAKVLYFKIKRSVRLTEGTL